MPEAIGTTCPHCGTPLEPLDLPEALFDYGRDLACFSDACPYFVRGWAWMEQQFGVKRSYRYRIDSQTGQASPLAVWTPPDRRAGHRPDAAPADAGGKEHP